MFCVSCGAQLPDDSSFCTYCGKPVVKIIPAVENQQNAGSMVLHGRKAGPGTWIFKLLVNHL